MNQPVFITGAERSGSSLIARILKMCDAFTGTISSRYENYLINDIMERFLAENQNGLFPDPSLLDIPVNWWDRIQTLLDGEEYKDGVWLLKSAKLAQMWTVWHYAYPNAYWLIVRRRTADVIDSCCKTGFMETFKNGNNIAHVGASTEKEGWLWWVHQYEKQFVKMIETGLNCKIVWPERMIYGDYQQIWQTIDWLGLKWNDDIIPTIDPILSKTRRKLDDKRR